MRFSILIVCLATASSIAPEGEVDGVETTQADTGATSTSPCVPRKVDESAISFYCTICFKMTGMVLQNHPTDEAAYYFKYIYCPKLGIFSRQCLKAIDSLVQPIKDQLRPTCADEPMEVTISSFCQNVVGFCYLQDNSQDCPFYALGIPSLLNQVDLKSIRDEL